MRSILKYISGHSHFRKLVMSLAVVVVFITTYMLILPAFTLTHDKADDQGGIDLPQVSETLIDTADEQEDESKSGAADADETADSEILVDKENTGIDEASEVFSDANDNAIDKTDKADAVTNESDPLEKGSAQDALAGNGDEATEEIRQLLFDGEGYSVTVEDRLAHLLKLRSMRG